MPENTRHFIPLALTTGVPRSLPPGAHSLVEEPRCKQNKSRARQRSGLCLESREKLQGCSSGRLWSRARVDCDPGSWALTADRCTFLMPETGALAQSCKLGTWGSASTCRSLGLGATPFLPPQQPVVPPVPSHPPTGGSSQCLLFFPGLPRGRRGAGGGPGAGGGAGLPGQPLQVHEGATHAHREGAPSRLQAECVPGVQAGRGSPVGDPIQAGCRAGTPTLGSPG